MKIQHGANKKLHEFLQVASSFIARLAIVAVIVSPLIAGGIWIYQDSTRTFHFQRNIRVAQNTRENIRKEFLEMEESSRGFADSRDPKFLTAYQHSRAMIFAKISALAVELHALNLDKDAKFSMTERSTMNKWEHEVSTTIIVNRRNYSIQSFRNSERSLRLQIEYEDQRLGALLNEAASIAEERRQRLLHHLLIATPILVTIVAVVVLTLLEARANALRRMLEQTLLYEQERQVATRLQQELIPDKLPSIAALDLHAIYVPASSDRLIGGDWYDAVELQGNRILFMIGDVAGHGMDAALIMNRVRHQILSAAFSESDPAMILKRTNSAVIAKISPIVTAACCIFELDTHRMIYATAGHPAPIIVPTTGPAFILPSGAPPLGVLNELEIVPVERILDAGSMIVLYTDGLFEESMDVLLGQRILLKAVEAQRDSGDPAAAIYGMVFPNDRKPRDDVAILTVRTQVTR